jgi:hypothetical protein
MMLKLRAVIVLLVSAMATIALFVDSASATHPGALVTCDNGDTYTLRAVDNGAGFQSPKQGDVLIFKEGGVLTVLRLSVNGDLRFSFAETGRAKNAVTEVTCSFTIGAGAFFEVTGVLNAR